MIEMILSLRKYSKGSIKYLILNLITAIIGNSLILINPILIGKLIETLVPGEINITNIIIRLVIIGSLYSLGAIIIWISQLFSNKFSISIVSNLREEAFNTITKSEIKNIDSLQTGDIMSRFSNDLDLVYDALSNFFMNMFQGGTTIIISLSLMLYLNVYLTLVVVLVVPVILVYSKLTNKLGNERFFKLQELNGNLTGSMKEYYDNKALVKSYNYEDYVKDEFNNINEDLTKVATKAYFQASINNPTYRLFNNFAFAGLGLVSILLVYNGMIVETALLTSMIMYAQMFQKPFNEYSVLTANFMAGKAGLNRVFNLLELTSEENIGIFNIKDRATKGEVVFDNVSFSYNKDVKLIEGFNLKVKSGSTVAIVGPTGAGKSTLINLLLSFYKLDKGSILIDGIDINEYNKDTLRTSFGLVLQEPWLFGSTIRRNLKYGKKDASDLEMVEACKKSNCHDFISNLKDGYDTVLDDRVNLSVGQRQLLTIARALIIDPPMFVLDEATSNIDSLMEFEIRKTFDELMKGKTNFIVAHRLKTIENADVIIAMKDGRIEEQGTHLELISKKGFYYELYMSQFNI